MLIVIEYIVFIWVVLMGWLWFGEVVMWFILVGVVFIIFVCWIIVLWWIE